MARRPGLVHCMAIATVALASLAIGAAAADLPVLDADDSDPQLVAAAVAHYGGRRQASRAIANVGWQLLRSGQPDDALAVFDQARRVDPEYYDAHWGLGAVLLSRGRVDEAIVAIARANRLPDVDEVNRAPLISDLANLFALKALLLPPGDPARPDYIARANEMFAVATRADPANPQPWLQWVAGLYYEARYAEAWKKVAAARSLGHVVPEALLEPLRAALAEPAR